MPNIRIKDIPTTASATSSTDFIGIDGSANGTRKLNAYSPTFGGNLTVSGNTVVSGASKSFKLRDTAITDSNYDTLTIVASAQKTFSIGVGTLAGFPTQLTINGETNLTSLAGNLSVAGNLVVGAGTSISGVFSRSIAIGNTSYPAYSLSSTAAGGRYLSFGQDILGSVGSWVWHDETGAAYRMALKGDSGNLLLGTTTDSGNGKLQLATHTTSAGGIGFGSDTSLYRTAAGAITVSSDGVSFTTFTPSGTYQQQIYRSGADAQFRLTRGGVRDWDLVGGSTFQIKGDGTTALTLDSGQNATFAGNYVYIGGGTSFYLRATGSGNGLWYGNNASFDGNSFSLRNQAGTVTNHSFDSSKVFIANTQAVPATPTGGGHLYVEGGALKYKGSSGTVTTIANA